MSFAKFLIRPVAIGLSIWASVGVAACSDRKDNHDPVAFVRAGDAEIAAAQKQAMESYPAFLDHLANPASDEHSFAVKFKLGVGNAVIRNDEMMADGAETDEFIWANNLTTQDNGMTLRGEINDTPLKHGYHHGQQVIIHKDDIMDWGYSKGEVMQGNFTTRVLLNHMPAEEAASVRKLLGWR